MNDFFRWLLGIRATPDWAAGGRWSFEFQSLPRGVWSVAAVAAAVAVVLGVWWLYRREGRQLGLGTRTALAAMRYLIFLGVAFMLLELTIVITKREQVPSHLLVLVDASQSMGLSDPYTDLALAQRTATGVGLRTLEGQPDVDALRARSRLELARQALDRVLPRLGEGRVVAHYRFANQLDPLPDGDPLSGLSAEGTATGVGDALQDAIAAHRGQPMAGVLLVTDGRSNSGDDPTKVAAQAGADGIPVHALAVGTEQGPRNARLADLEVSPVIFIRDPIEISVLTESKGLADVVAGVVLEQRQDDGSWKEIGRQDLLLGEDAVVQRVVFPFTPDRLGQTEFRARVEGVEPELTDGDNEAVESVKVVRQGIRVLLIAGYPSPEMQFMRNALLRDTALEFASWLQNAGEGYEHIGHRPLRRLPATLQELEHYDVVVLFDPDMRALGPSWPEMLTKFAGDAGGGLIYIAGELYSQALFNPEAGPLGAAGVDNSWLRALPVAREPGLYQSAADVRLGSRDTWTLELTPEADADPIFRFDPDAARNREVLASLPGMYWHFPVTRAKPGATVLARHGDPRMRNAFGRHVLMATQLYGPGRTVFIGFDSTYRWRYLHEEYFDGFWARLIDRVGRNKVLGGRYPFTLATDKSVYRVGDRVAVRAQFVETDGGAAAAMELRGEVEGGASGEPPMPLSLEPAADDPSVLEAAFTADKAGAFVVRVLPATATDLDAGLRPATLPIRVEPPQQEIDNPTLDRAALDAIAAASGGSVIPLVDADRVADAFTVRQVERVLEYRDEVWDAPLLAGLVLLFLTIEWVLRKKYRMS